MINVSSHRACRHAKPMNTLLCMNWNCSYVDDALIVSSHRACRHAKPWTRCCVWTETEVVLTTPFALGLLHIYAMWLAIQVAPSSTFSGASDSTAGKDIRLVQLIKCDLTCFLQQKLHVHPPTCVGTRVNVQCGGWCSLLPPLLLHFTHCVHRPHAPYVLYILHARIVHR